LFIALHHDAEKFLAATAELMLLHVNQDEGRVAAMPTDILMRLEQLSRTHVQLPMPPQVGRKISLTR